MKRLWTEKEALEWYRSLPWQRGCNFLPSNCVNRLDMWQSYHRAEHLEVADRELALCKETGFNTVRLWANFDAYYAEPKKFMDTLEMYLSLCDKHSQRVMLVLGYEEDLPYGDTFVPKKLGEQKSYGNHFNRDYELQASVKDQTKHYLEYPEIRPVFLEMVKKIVKKYRADERILSWNIWNEPGIGIGNRMVPILREMFELVRSFNPIQPLCADIWRGLDENGNCRTEEEQVAFELSDIVSFHSYSRYEKFSRDIYLIKEKTARPIFVTEWLNRCLGNTVELMYPLMAIADVACYMWGFVAGMTLTTEPWEAMWKEYEKNPNTGFDFTKWQHELYRLNGHPYNPAEIDVIKKWNGLKDRK